MSAPFEDKPQPKPHEYTVGWISALPIEYAAATAMLDNKFEQLDLQDNDSTLYTLGQICGHNVVIACLPAGLIGIASAASVATALLNRFPNVRMGLMVGIGGGAPSYETDVRLGDVVVSQPRNGHGGVVQYDMGKRLPNGKFERTSHLVSPPKLLLSALAQVQTKHLLDEGLFGSYLSKLEGKARFKRPTPDRLFQSDYQHKTGSDCQGCDGQKLIERDPRSEDEAVQFHYGTIASANSLIKDGIERDQICQDLGGDIVCFEMEAAGLMNNFPCLVIRGICDYADSHKNKIWQPYAAATAAAYAKEVLSVIPPKKVADLNSIKGTLFYI
jgi:nucleoside phosphorylase